MKIINSYSFVGRHMHIKFLQEGGPSSIQCKKRMVFLVPHLDLRVIMIHLVRGMVATAFPLGLVVFTSQLFFYYLVTHPLEQVHFCFLLSLKTSFWMLILINLYTRRLGHQCETVTFEASFIYTYLLFKTWLAHFNFEIFNLNQIVNISGMAIARDIKGKRERIVTVISNATTMGGQVYEAMSNVGYLDSNMVVILNDSRHSLHPKIEKGPKTSINALSSTLSKLQSSKSFRKLREVAKVFLCFPSNWLSLWKIGRF